MPHRHRVPVTPPPNLSKRREWQWKPFDFATKRRPLPCVGARNAMLSALNAKTRRAASIPVVVAP